ncbi:MAG: HlyD family secretion protein [Planctomycetota bacterium]
MSTVAPSAAVPSSPTRGSRRGRAPLVLAVVLAVAAVVGIVWYLLTVGRESTDDAFVAADVFQVNTKIAGRLASVAVAENQVVDRGQLLATLESADYRSRVAREQAAVALAQARLRQAEIDVDLVTASTANGVTVARGEVSAAEARLQQADADLHAADAEATRARGDRERYAQLSDRAVSRQRLAAVETDATATAAALQAARQRCASASADVAAARARLATTEAERARVLVAQATVEQRHAELQSAAAALQLAEQDLEGTQIVAPAAGRVTRKSVLPGTYVQPGQAIMAIVGEQVWVVANFKETQLEHMRPGQAVSVHVDAYGLDLDAHVDSIQAGSGAAFSLLPPENATGNYVKVVQRVPVKIVFERQPDARHALGPGFSVVPTVHVR